MRESGDDCMPYGTHHELTLLHLVDYDSPEQLARLLYYYPEIEQYSHTDLNMLELYLDLKDIIERSPKPGLLMQYINSGNTQEIEHYVKEMN